MKNMAGEKKRGRKVPAGVNPISLRSYVSVKYFTDLHAVVLGSKKELHQIDTVRKQVRTHSAARVKHFARTLTWKMFCEGLGRWSFQ